jgi:rSAM/selenodomain-associated transferase 2
VSVIIPALNEQPLIADAIRSAITAGACEVIVCDGGSDDDTIAVAQATEATVITSEAGRATQCNAAAKIAIGDVFLFLHADCQLHPDAIAELTRRLIADSSSVVGGFRQQIDDVRWRFRLIQFGNAVRVRTLKWVYGDQGIFIRAELFREIGGFPPVAIMEDLMLSRKAARRGRTILLDPPLLVSARRWKKHGVLRQTLQNWTMITLMLCRVPPESLAKFYPRVR